MTVEVSWSNAVMLAEMLSGSILVVVGYGRLEVKWERPEY